MIGRMPEEALTWANLAQRLSSKDNVRKEIANWGSGSSRAFAGMPVATDVDFKTRMQAAYQSARAKIEKVIAAPKTADSYFVLGALDAMGTGFAARTQVDRVDWHAGKGPKHLHAGFTAIVAGRYRQLKEVEEGKVGLAEVAEVDARFGEDQLRPSPREIEASRDLYAELQHSIPSNPTDKSCFKDEDWKIFLKAHDPLTERLTGQKGGKLAQEDPEKLEAQIKLRSSHWAGQRQGPRRPVCFGTYSPRT